MPRKSETSTFLVTTWVLESRVVWRTTINDLVAGSPERVDDEQLGIGEAVGGGRAEPTDDVLGDDALLVGFTLVILFSVNSGGSLRPQRKSLKAGF